MGGSDYSTDSSRIGKDGAVSISWQGNCDIDITNYVKNDKAIIAATLTSAAHTPPSQSFQLRFRNFTDSPGGAFSTLITGSGALRAAASAGCISNTDPVGSASGCAGGSVDASEEVENESPLQTASLSCVKNNYIETQWCVDFSNASGEKEYEFEIYDATAGASCGVLLATVTTEPIFCLPQTNSRIADATENWQGACDVDITGWVKTNDFILSTYAQFGHGFTSFKLQWKVAGGSFADVGAATTINYNANTSLVDKTSPAGPVAGCLSRTESEENEGDNIVLNMLMGNSSIVEILWGLDISGALDDTIYEFQLVCTTDSTQEVCSCSIRTQSLAPSNVLEGKLINRKINPYINERMN